jgi:hypothetical protein
MVTVTTTMPLRTVGDSARELPFDEVVVVVVEAEVVVADDVVVATDEEDEVVVTLAALSSTDCTSGLYRAEAEEAVQSESM